MAFQTIGKFLVAFARLTLGKVGVDGVEKVTSDINFILSPYYRSYSADRDFYINHCQIVGCYGQ